ncbi:MAG: hypothetical protein ACPHID_06055 [Thermoplasmatota archaeon]
MADKPAILQDSTFTVEESILYKLCRTGAIWMNKLFFSAAALLAIWLLAGAFGGVESCTEGFGPATGNNTTTDVAAIEEGTCSVLLTPTAKYLGAMTILSFIMSLVFGGLGLIVGKNILEVARTEEEAGSEESAGQEPPK